MIESFACKDTEKIWNGRYSRRFPTEIQQRALSKLRLLDAATSINDLRVPPGNHLEQLKGERANQVSIRINDQWRICFIWLNNNACNVEITDYH